MPTWGAILKELQQAQASGVPNFFDTVRRKYLGLLAKQTGRSAILYATRWTSSGGGDPGLLSVTPEDMQGFMEVVHQLPEGEGLDLIVHSPGGSAEATEAIVKYLRTKYKDVRVIVPHAAMSAATMLACSANKILLGKHSFLGPIDPQMVMATEQGRTAVAAHAILEQFTLAQQQITKTPAMLSVWLPILKQYGPALIVQCRLAQELSESLVADWLANYMFAGDPSAQAKGLQIASALANHLLFKSHNRFIDRAQAKGLGLLIDDLEADQVVQDLVLSTFHATMHTFNATGCQKIIENHLGKAWIKAAQPQVVMQAPAGIPFPFPLPGGIPGIQMPPGLPGAGPAPGVPPNPGRQP